MQQLHPVPGQIQVNPPIRQIAARTPERLRPQTIVHLPTPAGEAFDAQGRVTLTAVLREIDDRQVKLRRFGLPLDQDHVLRRWIPRPRFTRFQERGPTLTDSGTLQGKKHLLVKALDLNRRRFHRAAQKLDTDSEAGAFQLAVMQQSHPGQTQDQPSRRAMFGGRKNGGDPRFIVVLQKVRAARDELRRCCRQTLLHARRIAPDQFIVNRLVVGVVKTQRSSKPQ